MKKILLLENKEYRQKILTIDLRKCVFLRNVLGDDDCNILLDNFLNEHSTFDEYDIIIIHESIYYDEKREKLFDTLNKYCLEKSLIKFSGNNTQFSLENEYSLQLNTTSLYENLEIFLKTYENCDSSILMLALGENWYLNVLLNSLEKLNTFIENNTKEKVQKSIFSSKVGLTKIKKVNPESYSSIFCNINSNVITTTQMEEVATSLKSLIQDKVNE